ncbi:two-component sensor histidine kinase, partial [Streptomyces sp. SID7982]|nr:two-component sensor histidine kinase [Streptomyces sp. SID7982]
ETIARAHDGTLLLTPRADGGLRVTVELPSAAGSGDGRPARALPSP